MPAIIRCSANIWLKTLFVSLHLCLAAIFQVSGLAEAAEPVKIAVFDFELLDTSAGAGLIGMDDFDRRYLAEASSMARQQLVASGGYTLVDTKSAANEVAKIGALRDCHGCEAGIAARLGGDIAMTGVVNRISRTEYELLIKLVDSRTGANVASGFSGIRMGANYSWPRGVKALMQKSILPVRLEK